MAASNSFTNITAAQFSFSSTVSRTSNLARALRAGGHEGQHRTQQQHHRRRSSRSSRLSTTIGLWTARIDRARLLSTSPQSPAPTALVLYRAMSSSTANNAPNSGSSYQKVLTTQTINPHVLNVQYAVRGELSNRANKYAQLLHDGKGKQEGLKFESVVTANIGNPQQRPGLEQEPLTFWRQVAALTEYPRILSDNVIPEPAFSKLFPADARRRAQELLEEFGSTGAYSHSKGGLIVRKHVAEFIEERDGHPSDPEMIFLTSGASGGVSSLMQILISSSDVGVMIPIPQYPLYSATLSLYDAKPVPYYLDEANDWAVNVEAMAKSVDEARAKGVDVRACVVINPGNPTGGCLSTENIQDLIRMAHSKRLVLFADEVYQANIYQPETRPFVSFKKILRDFSKSADAEEQRIADETELVSFHSISKGVSGECGRRGGYYELCNIDEDVVNEVYKMASVNLCPSVQGQIGVDLLVKPPREGEESYALWKEETEGIHATLMRRSQRMRERFEQLEGVSCNEAQGALYLFPQITLPPKAVEAAKEAGKKPDEFYCLALLDATGICVVPGSGFGQKEGTFHFRTTVLAKQTDDFIERVGAFHQQFYDQYR